LELLLFVPTAAGDFANFLSVPYILAVACDPAIAGVPSLAGVPALARVSG
jgi:hypothetical protein